MRCKLQGKKHDIYSYYYLSFMLNWISIFYILMKHVRMAQWSKAPDSSSASLHSNESLGRSYSFFGHFQSLVNSLVFQVFTSLAQFHIKALLSPILKLLPNHWLGPDSGSDTWSPESESCLAFSYFCLVLFLCLSPLLTLWPLVPWQLAQGQRGWVWVENVSGDWVSYTLALVPTGCGWAGNPWHTMLEKLGTPRATLHHWSHSGCDGVFECVRFTVPTTLLSYSTHPLGKVISFW